MAKCFWYYFGETCDAMATTTLKTVDGQIRQMCERHHTRLVENFRKIALNEKSEWDKEVDADTKTAANHWFVLNKIPI
jgi:hypothetical protein